METKQTTPWLLCVAALHAITGLLLVAPVNAQTLDEAVRRQLNNDCFVMGGENPTFFGPDLNAICTMSFGSPSGTANSGGGGASSQTVAASVENRRKARLEEQSAAELVKRWSFFLNGNAETLDRNRTDFADGFDSTIKGAAIGVDYRFTQQFLAGTALVLRNSRGDFDGGGSFDTDSTGITLYTSFVPSAKLFIDVSAELAKKSHEVHRHANFVEFDNGGNTNTFDGLVDSDTDGSDFGVHVQTGYDHAIGRLTIGPRVGINWTRTKVDGYAETGGGPGTVLANNKRGVAGLALIYEDQETDSLQSIVGIQGSMSANMSFGVLVTQANVDYLHEFKNDQRLVNIRFVQDRRPAPAVFQFQTEKPVRDYGKFGLSFVVVLPHGVQPFLNLQGMIGNSQYDNYGATLGVRFEM